MSQVKSVDLSRPAADFLYESGQWQAAEVAYRALLSSASSSVIQLRIAECCFALANFQEAYKFASLASRQHQSMIRAIQIQSISARHLGKVDEWFELAQRVYRSSRSNPEFAVDYAHALLGVGDCVAAQELASHYHANVEHGERAEWLTLLSWVYDRPALLTAAALSERFLNFATRFVVPAAAALKAQRTETPVDSQKASFKIGFIGSCFYANEHLFMAMKTFEQLAQSGRQLVFFSRGNRRDWATEKLEAMGHSFVNCCSLSASELSRLVVSHSLDELYDMSGWLDPDALKVVASRPASRVFNWFGGQLCTTGLSCYDGFITDSVLTPPSLYGLYTERLVSLGSIRAMFSPKFDYLPTPRPRVGKGKLSGLRRAKSAAIGVCCPPSHVSGAFLVLLNKLMLGMQPGVRLVFIDGRYTSEHARSRIRASLDLSESRLQFLAVESHQDSLEAMNDLDLLIDPFPHSSGARLLEAQCIDLPVHVFPYDRRLYCERLALAFGSPK